MLLFIFLLSCGLLVYVLNRDPGVNQQNNLGPAAALPAVPKKIAANSSDIERTPKLLYLVNAPGAPVEYAETIGVKAEANVIRATKRAGVTLRDIFGIAQYLPANTDWDVDINEGAVPDSQNPTT